MEKQIGTIIEEAAWRVLRKIKSGLKYDPAIPLSETDSEEMTLDYDCYLHLCLSSSVYNKDILACMSINR